MSPTWCCRCPMARSRPAPWRSVGTTRVWSATGPRSNGEPSGGQGSSREHAVTAPRSLGLRLVLAVSFARIRWQNLVNFGVLPLEYADDPQVIAQGDVLAIGNLAAALRHGSHIQIHNTTQKPEIPPAVTDAETCAAYITTAKGKSHSAAYGQNSCLTPLPWWLDFPGLGLCRLVLPGAEPRSGVDDGRRNVGYAGCMRSRSRPTAAGC